jgi:glycine/serine hydroxymethyltransferase
MSALSEKILSLAGKIEGNNRWRQGECFNLIPSETTPSLLVKMCEISDPAGRYAEHRTMKGEEVYFYQGTDFIRDVEIEAQRELGAYFGCSEVELRPISGQMANEVVFKGMVKFLNRGRSEGQRARRMRLVMNNDLTKGGHLSSQPMGALFNCVEEDPGTGKENVLNFPVLAENPYKPDLKRLGELLETARPELLIFGKSMFIYPEPVEFVAGLVKSWPQPAVIMYDMAHVLGLYGAFQRPLAEGAVAGNFPPGSRLRNLWLDIKGRAFPGSTSNHHLATLLALLLAACEMNAFQDEYQRQVLANAKAFARSLKGHGVQVEGDERDGFTATHQVLVRVRRHGPGQVIARRLEENNIIVNYQALPDDESFLDSSGIRLGVQEMTRFGMVEKDFEPLAGYVAEVVVGGKNVRDEVRNLRRGFLEMKYCLPLEEAVPLAAKILKSVWPKPGLVERLAESLLR